MSALWQVRGVQAADLSTLAGWLPAADLETLDMLESSSDDQLLVAERVQPDGEGSEPLGCIRLRRHIGREVPRYWYHLGRVVHAAPDLGLYRLERRLLLGNDHTGAAELSDLVISPSFVDGEDGTHAALQHLLLSAALLLLQRDDAQLIASERCAKVIVALPGLRDPSGNAPFWEGFGRHFYSGSVEQAQARFGSLWLTYVAALLPRHPLVVSLLHADAQAAIGLIDQQAHSQRDALEALGLRAGQHISVHDGGPVYEASFEQLRHSQAWRLLAVHIGEVDLSAKRCVIAQAHGQNVWQLPASVNAEGALCISAASARRMGIGQSADAVVWVGI